MTVSYKWDYTGLGEYLRKENSELYYFIQDDMQGEYVDPDRFTPCPYVLVDGFSY